MYPVQISTTICSALIMNPPNYPVQEPVIQIVIGKTQEHVLVIASCSGSPQVNQRKEAKQVNQVQP